MLKSAQFNSLRAIRSPQLALATTYTPIPFCRGGGWCESVDNCAARAYSWMCYVGSSDPKCFSRAAGDMPPWENYSTTMDFTDIPSILGARWGGGMLINDPLRNPVTADWNKVELCA